MVRDKLGARYFSRGPSLLSLAPRHVFASLPIPRLQATVEE